MSPLLHDINAAGAVETAPIPADRLIEGAPIATTILDYQIENHTFVGEWRCDIGAWRVAYSEWEFCHVLYGACEIEPDGEAPLRYKAGDSFVIEPGFTGVWRVLAPMGKRFVVRM